MQIIVVGTAEYEWAVRIFAHLFRKHWGGDEVTWWGDRCSADPPLPFRRVPAYGEGVWPWTPWFSNGLRSILAELTAFTVALFLPDHWLSKRVDHAGVNALRRFMEADGRVVRGNLTAGTCLDGYGRHVATSYGREIVTVAPSDVHCGLHGGITFCPSLWTRGLLRDAMAEPHWNLWQAEREGTNWMVRRMPELYCVGVKPGPLERCHGIYHGRGRVADFTGLSDEDFHSVRGFVPEGWKIERN